MVRGSEPYVGREMSRLSVSVIVPTYNRVALLDRALCSALPDCEPGDEIIVVDDGSTDGTEAVVRAYGAPVRYLRTEHRGAGAARNAGIAAATGDLVAFLDSDDEWIPGKLSWQRAVLEHFPEILFVFSDFGSISTTGERLRHRITSWQRDHRPWDQVLGPGASGQAIPGMPVGAPPFTLHIGPFFASYIRNWCIYTLTVVVRRVEAGDALHFAEDVPTLEDFECYARLAQRGLAGYMDCETAWQRKHDGARLTDANAVTTADTALKIIERVWGTDEAYVGRQRRQYEAAIDEQRVWKARALMKLGRNGEARVELASCFERPWPLYLLTHAPGGATRAAAHVLHEIRKARGDAERQESPAQEWGFVEYRGRAGLEELEADWRRLCESMPLRSAYHAYEAHLASVVHRLTAPDGLRCLALTDGQRVRAICVLEASVDSILGIPLRAWRAPPLVHTAAVDVICPEDEVRRRLLPILVAHLRRMPDRRRLLYLGPLPADSIIWDGLRQLPSGECCVTQNAPAHVADCTRPFGQLIEGLSRNARTKLRKVRKRLGVLADVSFVTVTDEPDLAAEFGTFLDVEASGWKGPAGTRSAIRCRSGQPAFPRSDGHPWRRGSLRDHRAVRRWPLHRISVLHSHR